MKAHIFEWQLLLILPLLVAASPLYAEVDKSNQPIRVITNDWTSQIVLAHITAELFKRQGYAVEFSSNNTDEQWGALALGFDHVQVEVWQGTMSTMFNRMVAEKKIVDAGTHAATTREEWWYPSYVEALCPGLPDWKALRRCANLFATEQTGELGRYVAGPWEKPEEAKIRALDLGFVADPVEQADDLWRQLAQAEQANKAIVLFNWTPNWVEDRYSGAFVEFPAYSPECEINPTWGVNPDYHHDCGNPKNGWLKKAAWSGMEQQWPCAFATLQNINFNNAAISKLAAQVDVDKGSYQEVAQRWLKENVSLWTTWLPANCQALGNPL